MQTNQNIKSNSLTHVFNKVTSNRLFWIITFSFLTVAGAK